MMTGRGRWIVERLDDFSPNDPIYERLLLAGPLVVVAIAVFGRSLLTIGVAVAYILAFVSGVLYRGLERE